MNYTVNSLTGQTEIFGEPSSRPIQREHSAAEGSLSVSDSVPPYCITGVSDTLREKVDWLAFTLPVEKTLFEAQDLFPGSVWDEMPRGLLGYSKGLVWGAVKLLYCGQASMGIHVLISGDGCRQLESSGVVSDWSEFMRKVFDLGGSVTRTDIAIDDQSGLLDLSTIRDYAESGLFVGARTWCEHKGGRRSRSGNCLQAYEITFGSRQSESYVKFYDKALEQGVEGHWVRCELEVKCDRANMFWGQVLASGEFGQVAYGVLLNSLDFKEDTCDSNMARRRTASWWAAFLEAAEKLKLSLGGAVKTLEDVRRWVKKQVAPSLALLLLAGHGDLEEILSYIEEGRKRLKPAQLNMLSATA